MQKPRKDISHWPLIRPFVQAVKTSHSTTCVYSNLISRISHWLTKIAQFFIVLRLGDILLIASMHKKHYRSYHDFSQSLILTTKSHHFFSTQEACHGRYVFLKSAVSSICSPDPFCDKFGMEPPPGKTRNLC